MEDTMRPPHAFDANDQLVVRRRKAFFLFLIDPTQVIVEFPDLVDELRLFFRHSINPHQDLETEGPVSNSEEQFERWEAARRWARR